MSQQQMTFCGQPQWLLKAVIDGKKTVQQIGSACADTLRKAYKHADRLQIDPVMEVVK